MAQTKSSVSTNRVIGTDTVYVGNELKFLRGERVRIIGVIRNALRPGVDYDEDVYTIVENEELARIGGVTKFDRIEVVPYIGSRVSFVASDPRAQDLECFAGIDAER